MISEYASNQKHKLSNFKGLESVATNIYGIMDDPLLSFLVKTNKSKIAYVQHGGGQGLNKRFGLNRIEEWV